MHTAGSAHRAPHSTALGNPFCLESILAPMFAGGPAQAWGPPQGCLHLPQSSIQPLGLARRSYERKEEEGEAGGAERKNLT